MKKLLVLLVLALALSGMIAPAAAQMPTIAEIVVTSTTGNPPEFTVLLAAVQAADPAILAALSDPQGNLTVFAPTDAAFGQLLSDLGVTAPELLANSALLTQVLSYHVIPGRFDAAALTARSIAGQPLDSLEGTRILFNRDQQGNLRINSSNVVAANIMASNGIVHVIDRVLLPSDAPAPLPTIAELVIAQASANPAEFTILLAAVQAASPAILSTLNDFNQNLTVFAPTDAAFGQLLSDLGVTAPELLANRALLDTVLLYHVIGGRFDGATLLQRSINGQPLPTLQGTQVLFNLDQQGNLRINSSNVIAADIRASNGIVHVIDRVLLPSDVAQPTPPTPTPEPPPALNSIAEIVVAATQANPAEFTILLAAVQNADPAVLATLSDDSQNLTVFAPTDAAFAELLTRLNVGAADLLANEALLTQVLLYHVIPGRFDGATLLQRSFDGRPLNSLEGTRILFNRNQQNDLRINASNVIAANLLASNGIIHVIDRVLLPSDVSP
jgi:transforming growth factor-beta-induced protein